MKIMPLVLASTLFFASAAACAATDAAPVNRIVALVNNNVITEVELDNRLAVIKQQIAQRGTAPPPEETLRKQVLERLINDEIQLQLAEATGIRVDDDTLNKTVARLAANNKLSLDQFRQAIEADGFSYNQFREDIRKELIMRRLHDRQVIQRVHVTGTEVDQYLHDASDKTTNKDYHLAHILVALPEAPTAEQLSQAQQKIDTIISKIKEGDDFAQLAISYSDGQQALDGGDLGWRRGNELPTLFAKTVPRLKAGEVSEVIRGPNGFHIIKLMDTKGGDVQIAEQTLARHILIKTNAIIDDNAAAKRLGELRERILKGEDFAALAKEFSDDPGSASKGGNLGWASPGDMVPEFEAMMNSLKPGELSTPFKSSFGWHIVEVLERRKEDISDEMKRRQAQQTLQQRKIEQETESWLLRLREEAYVELRPN